MILEFLLGIGVIPVPKLSEAEKLDLYQKLRVFMAKQPRRFEPLR